MKLTRKILLILVLVTSTSGATCLPRGLWQKNYPTPPVVFEEFPTLQEVLAVVNNNQRVKQLDAQGARISAPGTPRLRASMALERPRHFRLRAGLFDFSGPELDLGSNDELFWIWIKQHPQPAIYYARHDEFIDSQARQRMPVDFGWFNDALGLVELDPKDVHEGPLRAGKGKLEIRTRIPAEGGEMLRVIVIDDRYGWVLEQHLRDPRGQLLVSIHCSRYRFYPAHGVSLPHQVEIHLLPGHANQMKLELDVAAYQINRVSPSPQELWEMPSYEGYPQVDIITLPVEESGRIEQQQREEQRRAYLPESSASAFRPRFRGDTTWR
jgi:hypothetical protein